MRRIQVKNEQEIYEKHNGKIYGISDRHGDYLFDVYEDEFIEMGDKGLLDTDTYRLKVDYNVELKEEYALEVLFTEDKRPNKLYKVTVNTYHYGNVAYNLFVLAKDEGQVIGFVRTHKLFHNDDDAEIAAIKEIPLTQAGVL